MHKIDDVILLPKKFTILEFRWKGFVEPVSLWLRCGPMKKYLDHTSTNCGVQSVKMGLVKSNWTPICVPRKTQDFLIFYNLTLFQMVWAKCFGLNWINCTERAGKPVRTTFLSQKITYYWYFQIFWLLYKENSVSFIEYSEGACIDCI